MQFKDGDFIVEIAGTHKSHPDFRPNEYSGDYEMKIFSLTRFLDWYDTL